MQGLPDGLLERNAPRIKKMLYKNYELQRGVVSAIKEARIYDYPEKGRIAPRHRCARGIFFNLMRALWCCLPSDAMENTELNAEVLTRLHWERGEDRFAITGRPNYLLTSRRPLPVFADAERVAATKDHEFEDGGPVAVTVDLIRNPGIKDSKEKIAFGLQPNIEFGNPHTMINLYISERTKKDIFFHQTMFQFAYLASYAMLHQGARFGDVLDTPLTMQSIAFSGKVMFLNCFQLNTLDLNSDDGVKNMAWQHADRLYTTVVSPNKDAPNKLKVVDFNKDCFVAFLSLLLGRE